MGKRVVTHPATLEQLRKAAEKLIGMRGRIQETAQFALAGAVSLLSFQEVEVLRRFGYLSENEENLLRRLKGREK